MSLSSARAGYGCCIAALLVFFGCQSLQSASADGETRTISFHHIHTNEDLTITYKVNGRYDEDALGKINHLLRDWRESEPIKMDPHLIDLLWEVHREVGGKEPIWVVCGYRSPETNSMLRKRSSGVAQFSQHMLGKAVDFYIPGVPLDQLRAAGLRAQRGGVGFYPTSGSPFVHLDTGSVRHWPRMPEEQLASVLAKGQLASHHASDRGTVVAQGDFQRSRKTLGFLAKLFGGGKDEEEDAETAAAPAPTPPAPRVAAAKPAVATAAVVPLPAAKPVKPETFTVASAASKPAAKPTDNVAKPADTYQVASAASKPAPAPATYEVASATSTPVRPAQAASLVGRMNISANDIINERGYWQGLPSIEAVDAPQAARAAPAQQAQAQQAQRRQVVTASADPAATASLTRWPLADRTDSDPLPNALAYAAQPTPIAAARTVPMGTGTSRAAPADTTVAVKRSDDRPAVSAWPETPVKPKVPSVVRVGDRFNDPWLRAMIVSPSAQGFMRTTMYGVQDFRNLAPHLQKPTSIVMMTFSQDPYLGVSSEKFDGSAVVFIATVTFSSPRTASLR